MIRFAEARFYFRIGDEVRRTLALVSLFSKPDEELLQHSHGVLTVCEYEPVARLVVIDFESISAVVGMVPFGESVEGQNTRYFLAEKLGLDVYDPAIVDEDDDI
jgi:hypothetical protein